MKPLMRRRLVALGAIALGFVLVTQVTQSAATACGLDPMINGGFTVSHPQAIGVAVAVADARRSGVLPAAANEPVPNDVLLRRILGDLRELQSRLSEGQKASNGKPRSSSVVLVGPGLWSHFFASHGAVLARYHTHGLLPEKDSALTHHAMFKALLAGKLSAGEASARRLLVYTDGETDAVREIFETGQGAPPTKPQTASEPFQPHRTIDPA